MTDPQDPNNPATVSGKSAAAFRTISEVAGELDLPQHVLRFWESKFSNIRPLKRGGGRRYYRPEDVVLLRHIRTLLYEQGYTIKGVQKLLRQNGARAGADAANGDAVEGALVRVEAGAAPPSISEDARAELETVVAELEYLRDLMGDRRA